MGVVGKIESYQYYEMIDEETECVFDFETNGIKKGFRLPHQLAVVDINSDKIEVINNRIPSYELPNPTALNATTTEWSKLLEGPSLYEKIFQKIFLNKPTAKVKNCSIFFLHLFL